MNSSGPSSSHPQPDSPERLGDLDPAGALYLEAVSRTTAGVAVDVEQLVREHASLASELRAVHEAWTRVALLRAGAEAGSSLAGRLQARYGASLGSGRSLDEDARDETKSLYDSGTLERLAAHASAGTRYQVSEEVGRGGMGAVFKIWDPDLRRTLAMKVLHPGESREADSSLARFLEEAQITGQLDHPGVVPVHELGLDDSGQVYFTMRLVRGRDLEHVIDLVHRAEEGWTLTRAVQVVLKVCEAMAYAHDKGVLHRDLKPANIMVGRFGEVYVMDWGLSRILEQQAPDEAADATQTIAFTTERTEPNPGSDASPYMTLDGDVLGTPAYMPPEQARGDLSRLDPRSDVYSLGAILYHLLAGHAAYTPPGSERDAIAVWERVVAGPPEPLAERASDAPGELVAIAEKAMAYRRVNRYVSMLDMAEDLHAYLEGHVVRAYEAGAVAEFRKWVRRNRATALASAAAILLLLFGLGGFSCVQSRFNRDLEEKNELLAEAKTAVTLERDAGEQVIQYMIGLFQSPDPEHARGAEITAKELLDRGAATIESYRGDDALVWSRLMEGIGGAYHSLGLYDEAEPLVASALEQRLKDLGEDHPDTIAAIGDLAEIKRSQGHYDDAERLYRQALDAERDLYGEDDVRTLATTSELGLVRFYQGRYDESEEFLRTALDGMRAALGDHDPASLDVQSDLARLYRKQARYDEALPLFLDVLEQRRVSPGDDHPATLKSMNDLAGVYLRERRVDEALPLFLEALDGRRRVLGEHHPETLITLNDLAVLYRVDGQPELAEPLYLDALAGYRDTLGEDHPFALAILGNLAGLYQTQGRYEEAEPLFQQALEGSTRARGAEHPNTLSALNGLAQLYAAQKRYDEAEPLYTEALEKHREVLGDDHPNTLTLIDNLASLYAAQGRYAEAEPLAAELVSRTPPDDPLFDARRKFLGRLLSEGD